MATTKLYILLIIAMTAISFSLQAQTSIEEYNYVTKGYKVQIESGLDMKNGYEVADIEKKSTKERTAELKVLYRVKDGKKIIAAYMVVYQKSGNDKEYICVPHPKSPEEITSKYWTQLYDGSNDSSSRLQLICYLLSSKLSW